MKSERIKQIGVKHYNNVKEYATGHLLRKYIFFGITIGIIVGYFFNLGGKTSSQSAITEYTVALGNITNSVKAFGSAEIVDEQQLRFNQQGEVTKVYFKKGAEIKKGDIIAELDQDSVLNDILQAEINLANSQLQLQETLNGNTESQILQAENNLEQSKLKLDIAKQEYSNLLEQNSDSGAISDKETTLENAKLDIQNYIIEGEKIIQQLDTIFGVTPKYANYNDLYEIYLSAKNSSYKNETENSILLAYNKLGELKNYYDTGFSFGRNESQIIKGLNLTQNLYEGIYAATTNAYTALENSVANVDLTQSTIDSYKSSISSNSSKAKTSLSSIFTTRNQINNLYGTDDDAITLQSKKNEISNLENTIIIQEKTLEDLKNGGTEQQLQIAKNNVKQKELALENTKKNLDNLKIEAPFDGTIRKIDFKVGDKITSDEEKYVYLENPNLVEISITLDQVDVVNVKAGMKAEVELDAYPGETFEGVLGDIDSTPIVSNGVTSYTVKVAIDKGEKIIYSGMTATVKIIIQDKQNVIIIPTTFIQSESDKKIVLDKNDKSLEIIVGATDGTMTEVISGLTEGTIIRKLTTQTSGVSKSSSASSSFGMPGMGGGMGRPD